MALTFQTPQRRALSTLELCSAVLLGGLLCISLIACQNGQMKPGISLESINNGEAFDDIFSQKKTTQANKPSSSANDAVHNGSSFFTAPSGWTLISADDESGVYKLSHDEIEGASIVVSYDQLVNRGDGRLPELKGIHEAVITRLPDSLAMQQSEMTRHQGEPRYHTMLRGKPSQDSEEMIVSGYTVALVQDAFTVFAAYPVEARTLAADVESFIYSLRPYAPIEASEPEVESEQDASPQAGSDDAPQPSGEEP